MSDKILITKWTNHHGDYGADESIVLIDPDDNDSSRVFSVEKHSTEITFRELCDGYFKVTMSKEDALTAVEELRQWILNS